MMTAFEKRKILIDFCGILQTQRSYDIEHTKMDVYFILQKTDPENIILVNKNRSTNCTHEWKPDEDWNDLMLVIKRMCLKLQCTIGGVFQIFEQELNFYSNNQIGMFEFCVDWVIRFQKILNRE